MDYGEVLSRAWNIVWNNKWLILLGILVALGSGGGGGGNGGGYNFGQGDFDRSEQPEGPEQTPFEQPDLEEFERLLSRQELQQFMGLGTAVILALLCVGLVIAVTLGVVARIAAGGLIAGVDQIDGGAASSFGQAWSAGWARGWRLIGIGLVTAIPWVLLLLISIPLAIPLIRMATSTGMSPEEIFNQSVGLWIGLGALLCITILISLPLAALQALADRACIVENTGVWASYRRAWEVLTGNLGPAVLLFLIQTGIQIGLGLLLLLPSILMALCCLLWPVLLAISGTITAYFSTVWTLAWRHWTGRTRGSAGEPLPQPAPAV